MKPGANQVFERWSVARYRNEMGLSPVGPAVDLGAETAGNATRACIGSSGVVRSATKRNAPGLVKPPATAKNRKTVPLASGHPSEEDIHLTCADWVFAQEARYPILQWLMHVPNGGRRSRGEAGKLRAMGVRKGVSDWILPFPSPSGRYSGLAIELKSHRGTVSDEQQDFLDDAEAAGWLTAIVRSSDEFEKVVMTWIHDRT
jgi:hypothetical protein